jgi:uncharacterized protein YndB with AHSA1/START domain
MIQFEFWKLIDASPEVVFSYLSNLNNLPAWQGMIRSISPVPVPIRVGTQAEVTAEVAGRKIEGQVTITRMEPPDCLAYEMKAGPTRVTAEMFVISAGGGTRLDLHGQAEPAGILKLAEKAIQGQVQVQMQQNLETLKGILEQDQKRRAA